MDDIAACDLVLIVGTSLKVGGFIHDLLMQVGREVPQILINRDVITPPKFLSNGFDINLLGFFF
jgi:NAD-dependent SIR2 family protein deacetylase